MGDENNGTANDWMRSLFGEPDTERGLVGILVRFGIVKTGQQANMLLVVFIALMFIAMFFQVSSLFGGGPSGKSGAPLGQPIVSVPST